MTERLVWVVVSSAFFAFACADVPPLVEGRAEVPVGGEDLSLGEVRGQKTDRGWGAAQTCKPVPYVEPLISPVIVISIDGLTLRLFDLDGDYDRTFPVGVGAIEEGESLTVTSTHLPGEVFWARADWPSVDDGPSVEESPWAWNQKCRIWWQDPETGTALPVFGGLPWIRLEGPPTLGYGIHGPIDNFSIPSGGTLRRGYVSHGCVRMAAEDIKEVWGRIQGHKVPVRIQSAPERRRGGAVVDVEDNWLLSPCAEDADCRFEGGFCKANPYSGEGFCTRACERYCPDKAGHPVSFCVADTESQGEGFCTLKDESPTFPCGRRDHLVAVEGVERFADPAKKASVCLPGTAGWIGDRCFEDVECDKGLCTPLGGGPAGVCTAPCERFCPDKEGAAGTFCVAAPQSIPDEGGVCVARCTSDDDCAKGTACLSGPRWGQPEATASACVPL